MKSFKHVRPSTISEVSSILNKEKAVMLAGGTDLLGVLRERILPAYPDKVVSLSGLDELKYISEEKGVLKIGAMTTLNELEKSDLVKEKLPVLTEAAHSIASPILRNSATVGGNLCQDTRCWYYRYPHSIGGRVNCARKEGNLCYAMMGENRYHSIFGAARVNDPPCREKCPACTDIAGYMEKLRTGDIDGAAQTIMDVNPMPAITSRVCAHFCQEGCNRLRYDESLNIGSIERYVGDYILANADRFMKAPGSEKNKKASIVGTGPAGLTAAYYLRKHGYSVTMYERMKEAGGCLMYAIPAYRLPKDIVRRFVAALENMGVEIRCGVSVGTDGLSMEEIYQKSDCVMLDTGTWKRPLIGVAGEELTRFGLDFLVDVNNFIHERPGADVIVVGGGNVAVDVAITAKRLGVPKVSMVCLEKREEMPAGIEEIERVLEEGVDLVNGWGPKRILHGPGGVNGVEFKKVTSVFDKAGKFAPRYDEEKLMEVKGDVVLMAIGQKADLGFLEGEFQVETERGRIKAVEGSNTSVEGIFAGGDVTTGPATVIQAVTAGRNASVSMSEYMCGDLDITSPAPCLHRFDPISRRRDPAVKQRVATTSERSLEKEDASGISETDLQKEIARCFNCGCMAVNPSDLSNVLIALDAFIVTNMRRISAESFFTTDTRVPRTLEPGEIVLEVEIPLPAKETILRYDKFRLRKSIDFAVLSLATAYTVRNGYIADARVVLGAAAPIPMRMYDVERFLIGKIPSEAADEAAELALKDALPMENNSYKIDIAKVLMKRSLAF
ncbi:MAG: FAD binding domain-containing protein [Synergistaceae bacterium]|nr:FAD binding domain-containing protein [Synergistaceae bacterium]